VIIIFDSLSLKHPPAIKALKEYIIGEAASKHQFALTKESIAGTHAKVPGQSNHCDCGVFLLHYVEKFLSDPGKYLPDMLVRSSAGNINENRVRDAAAPGLTMELWGSVESKRQEIQNLIVELGNPTKEKSVEVENEEEEMKVKGEVVMKLPGVEVELWKKDESTKMDVDEEAVRNPPPKTPSPDILQSNDLDEPMKMPIEHEEVKTGHRKMPSLQEIKTRHQKTPSLEVPQSLDADKPENVKLKSGHHKTLSLEIIQSSEISEPPKAQEQEKENPPKLQHAWLPNFLRWDKTGQTKTETPREEDKARRRAVPIVEVVSPNVTSTEVTNSRDVETEDRGEKPRRKKEDVVDLVEDEETNEQTSMDVDDLGGKSPPKEHVVHVVNDEESEMQVEDPTKTSIWDKDQIVDISDDDDEVDPNPTKKHRATSSDLRGTFPVRTTTKPRRKKQDNPKKMPLKSPQQEVQVID
jgi:Ulp1 protease family, C-terminal catalytic domain